MTTRAFINLPVEDLQASRAFYGSLGYTFNEAFSNDKSATVVISDTIFVMLLTRPYFATYVTTEVTDAHTSTETMLGLTADSRAAVDALVEKAFAVGATFARETQDLGFMYTRSFRDPDGHFWEVLWMDPRTAEQGPPA